MKGIFRLCAALAFFASAVTNGQVVTYCCDATAEQDYLAAIAGLGATVTESFETPPWNQVRSTALTTVSLPSITSRGITWSRPGGGITTSNARAHDGAYQVYAVDGTTHPFPDGFTVQGDGVTFNAFGGWYFGSNTKIRFIVDNDPGRVDFPGIEATIPQNWRFLGFIDTTPFSKVEIHEADEADAQKIFWADDFTFSTSGSTPSPGQLQFDPAAYSVGESGSQVQLTVSRTGGSDGAVTVDYATSDGSANASSDYTAASGTLNFADGQVSGVITVPILGDTDYEGNEDFAVDLASPTGGASLGAPASATVTITDDDPPPSAGSLKFQSASYTLAENAGSFAVSVTRSGGSFGTVTIDYATSDGTASAGSDYTAASGTLTFADGVTSKTFNVPVIDDADYENDESLLVSLANPGGGASLGAPSTATLTISDDDPAPSAGSLQLGAAAYTVDESGPELNVTVTRTGGSFGTVAVDYATTDGSAGAGSDYTATSGTLTFADGEVNKSFNVPIVDDSSYEGNETFTIGLANVSGGATLGARASASVTITDNDPTPSAGSLQFSGAAYSTAEDGGSVLLTVTRTGGSFGSVSVSYATTDGSATAGTDYSARSGTLAFANGETSNTFSVPVLDDSAWEGDESFTVALSIATGGASLGAPTSATVTIVEDDPTPSAGVLKFSGANFSVVEDGTSLLVTVVRTGGSFGAVSVNFATSDLTAGAGGDYTAEAGGLTFGDGVTSQSFSVTILDDTDYEGDETFQVSLSGPSGGATLGTPKTATITITENDPVPAAGSFQFSGAAYSVAENSGAATITVTRTGGSFGNVSVNYSSDGGTATAGIDYTATSGKLSFADGVTSRSFDVPVLDDTDFEGDETVSLSLTAPAGGATLGTPASAELTINDDDPVPPAGSLQFSGARYSVAEDDGTLLVTVTRNGGTFGAVSVSYASSDGSAKSGSDYATAAGTLNFADGDTSKTFAVTILDDTDYEGDESFTLALTAPNGGASLGVPASATVTISDDDAAPATGVLAFTRTAHSVPENSGTVDVAVSRTGGSFGTVTVDYLTRDGSATANSDYSTASGTLTFADGITATQTISIPILDDFDYEGEEQFSVRLSNVSGGASLGAPATATVAIADDELPPPAGTVRFGSAAYSVVENAASIEVDISRVDGDTGSISVDYSTIDVSATAGSDYQAASGTITFADGETSKTLSIPIIDDATYEGDESFEIRLANVSGGGTLGSPKTAAITITEDDPIPGNGALRFSSAIYAVAENAAAAVLTVDRVGGSAGAVSVAYETADDSATGGQDYATTTGTLSFAAGELSQSVTVPIQDDTEYEGDEAFTVTLSNPTGGAAVETPSIATVTISENDSPPTAGSLHFSGSAYSASEADGLVTVTVTRSGSSFGSVSVDYATSDDSALAGADYTAVDGTLRFADGVTSQSISVAISEDTDYEGTETFAVELSNAVGGAEIIAPTSAKVTIMDNDPPASAGNLQFSSTDYSAGEAGATVEITVSRVGGSMGDITVEYETMDGSASSGSDYRSTSGKLSIADGQTEASLVVELIDDSMAEGSETFSVVLKAPTGGADLGSPSTAKVTITDNDRGAQPDSDDRGGAGGTSPFFLMMAAFWWLVRAMPRGFVAVTSCMILLGAPLPGAAESVDDDPHANHKNMMNKSSYRRSVHDYDVDGINVTRSDAVETTLADLMTRDKPVMVHFIFTTCTTICPVQAATFAQVQRHLGDEAAEVQMVSVSIDPEYDTPERLKEYAKKFRAGPQWEFITGTSEQMIDVQKAFDAYEGNKMNHRPLTLIRMPGSDEWIRLEGLIGASVIIDEYRKFKSES